MKIFSALFFILFTITLGWSQSKEHHVISLPEMNILYRGYSNKLEFSTPKGIDTVIITVNQSKGTQIKWFKRNEVVVKIDKDYHHHSIDISCFGVTKKDTIQLGYLSFRIQTPPKPFIFWGGFRLDQINNEPDSVFYLRGTRLFARYGPETPLKAVLLVFRDFKYF